MANEASAAENLHQQLASNTARMTDLVDQQYDVEVTRSLVLCFSSPDEDCARALNKTLFNKGARVLQQAPEQQEDERFHIRVGVKHSIRDLVQESFVTDLVHTASGMNCSYDGWSLLTDETSGETQTPDETPGATTT